MIYDLYAALSSKTKCFSAVRYGCIHRKWKYIYFYLFPFFNRHTELLNFGYATWNTFIWTILNRWYFYECRFSISFSNLRQSKLHFFKALRALNYTTLVFFIWMLSALDIYQSIAHSFFVSLDFFATFNIMISFEISIAQLEIDECRRYILSLWWNMNKPPRAQRIHKMFYDFIDFVDGLDISFSFIRLAIATAARSGRT